MKVAIKFAAVAAAAAALTGAVAAPAQAATVNSVLGYTCSFGTLPNLSNENALISFRGTFDDTAQVDVATNPVDVTSQFSFSQSTSNGLAAVGASSVQFSGTVKLDVVQPTRTVPLYLGHSFPAQTVTSGQVLTQSAASYIPALTFHTAGTVEYRLSTISLTATLKNSSGATIGTSAVTCTRKPAQNNLVTTTVVS
ncbi:DUF6801 domain-containing protein [Actinomadura macrotermitis]|uniref:DUF6801 domain-containing protein n=1 Tax=Actinomadura macrotermitis TaxID=2585200 RepID=A0A7K0BTM1_9ACTN|nr:DUF6801 domain-containing protein [Actinomadura macrotermitis]MQY04543.1 hypothetical protein [Actinomadura macrotermitis]